MVGKAESFADSSQLVMLYPDMLAMRKTLKVENTVE